MLRIIQGNLLTADVEALVNTVNTMGAMGKGIALQFKKAFPDNFKAYENACKRHEIEVGRMFVTEPGLLDGPRFIINFPTKKDWRRPSEIAFIKEGLGALIAEVRARDIKSIAVPPLGCGLGGLPWPNVRALVEEAFAGLPDVEVLLYEPKGAPAANSMPNRTKVPPMTHARAAFLGAVAHYQKLLFYEVPSLLEVQKIAYFLQAVGEPLKLNYTKGQYGPYADNLRHVLSTLDGHYLSGWGEGENKPGQKIGVRFDRMSAVEAALDRHPETKARFQKVATLVEGFESPYGMELLGSVHWVAHNEDGVKDNPTMPAIVPIVRAWTQRKQTLFTPEHIAIAFDHLQKHGLMQSA